MSQTSYTRSLSTPFSGTLGDTGPHRIESYQNNEGADIPAGIAVVMNAEGRADEFDAPGDVIAGFSLNSFARNPGDVAGLLAGEKAIMDKRTFNVLAQGTLYVKCEDTLAAGADVYVRHTSDGGSNTQLGRVRSDSDSGKARLCRAATVLIGGTSTTPALISFDSAVEKAEVKADGSRLKVTLSASAEVANVITVTGAVVDLNGAAVTAAKQVLVRTLAVTADQGDLAVTAGTSKKIVNPTTGENVAWIETTAAGAFTFTVTNTAAEDTLVHVSTVDGLSATLKLTFA